LYVTTLPLLWPSVSSISKSVSPWDLHSGALPALASRMPLSWKLQCVMKHWNGFNTWHN
jgi:hypothetical protein